MNFFFSALHAPLNIKNRIILTEKDRKIIERRRKRKEAELKEKLEADYKRQQQEEERRWQKEKQNEILGAVAEFIFSSQLNINDKVYVKGHYRSKPKRKRR